LSVGGKTYNPEPLIYYAAVLRDAPDSKGAASFTEWLKGDEAQTIFRKYNYDLRAMPPRFRVDRRWLARAGATIFALVLLYPFTALFAHIGPWQWGEDVRRAALSSVRVSLLLTGCAMVIIVPWGSCPASRRVRTSTNRLARPFAFRTAPR